MAPSYGATNATDAQIFRDVMDINSAGLAFVAYGEHLPPQTHRSTYALLPLPHIALGGMAEKEVSCDMDLDLLHPLHSGVDRERRKHVP